MAAESKHTLTQLQSLTRLYQKGYRSPTIDASVQKLVSIEQAKLRSEMEELEDRLNTFEKMYHLSSEEFHHRFQRGEMGDDADMFEWDALYLMWLSAHEQLQTQRSEKPIGGEDN
jgi:hypothetical protein